jgi:hypothetical protein
MWHFRQSNNLLIFCVLILSAGFMLHFKILYNKHQKHLRIQEIQERMTEIANTIHTVEGVANTTDFLIKRLEKTVKRKPYRTKLKRMR